MSAMDTLIVRDWLLGLQQRIVIAMEGEDGTPFLRDAWQREPRCLRSQQPGIYSTAER